MSGTGRWMFLGLRVCGASVLALGLLACGDSGTPVDRGMAPGAGGIGGGSGGVGSGGVGSGGTIGPDGVDPCRGPDPSDHFPTPAGARFVFLHAQAGTVSWEETVVMSAAEFNGEAGVKVVSSGDPTGQATEAVWVRRPGAGSGDTVLRVHQIVTMNGALVEDVVYDPGFVRFDHAWLDLPVGNTFSLTYTRTDTDAAGMVMVDPREHSYTIEAQNEAITVGNCVYDTVRVLRQRVGFGNDAAKRFWFAPGVGKVREENLSTGSIETLQQLQL